MYFIRSPLAWGRAPSLSRGHPTGRGRDAASARWHIFYATGPCVLRRTTLPHTPVNEGRGLCAVGEAASMLAREDGRGGLPCGSRRTGKRVGARGRSATST